MHFEFIFAFVSGNNLNYYSQTFVEAALEHNGGKIWNIILNRTFRFKVSLNGKKNIIQFLYNLH